MPAPDANGSPALERIRRGVVTIEQGGHAIAIGTVLSGDGRILTALSGLGTVDQFDVRYADGTTLKAKVGHRDKVWDLAMLVPAARRWTEGLLASRSEPAGPTELTAFVLRANRAIPVAVGFKGNVEARARDNSTLTGAEDLDLHGASPVPGAPILDAGGGALGVLVQVCRPIDPNTPQRPNVIPPCTSVVVGAPLPAIKHFLMTAPATAVTPTPWLGIRGESEFAGPVKGVRVIAVATGSPADKGGLRANLDKALSDIIVAVDNQPIDTPDKLSESISVTPWATR